MRRVAIVAEAMFGCVLDADRVARSRMRLTCALYSARPDTYNQPAEWASVERCGRVLLRLKLTMLLPDLAAALFDPYPGFFKVWTLVRRFSFRKWADVRGYRRQKMDPSCSNRPCLAKSVL